MFKKIIAILTGHKSSGPFMPGERAGYGIDLDSLKATQHLQSEVGREQRRQLDGIRTFDRHQQEKAAERREGEDKSAQV